MSEDGRASASELACHATCLVLGEDGILIRGPAGSGKSSLCVELLDHADTVGQHARLVADDRVRLALRHGRIIARPHPAVAGLIELRGLGIRRMVDVAPAAVIRLVVDLVAKRPRLPDDAAEPATILGIAFPWLRLEPRQPRAYVIRQALTAMRQEAIVSPRSHSAAALAADDRDV
ncbi:HPr kinase/phosphorylase [Methylobacterium brachythecii]|uniref:HPr kinase n=1 Tax=Methylobacterium brachythecii TaxID=1176177 RepID=A0A7W6AD42_9HYPH|nr:HPr kinase/phosphatase C-terminal domain-containing protein [Methylobacterium brachythecii]MBB3901047.1 serine kinase of HPr protein (carbohydrate metabolism regulator) [Methylobacterium brachythecii]GLS46624.1 HPr kinase [Methylobacterium brachythecii]